jgi:hypothetical protein
VAEGRPVEGGREGRRDQGRRQDFMSPVPVSISEPSMNLSA